MCPEILPLYGQFSIQSYGLALAFGLVLFCWLILKDPKRAPLIRSEKFLQFLTWGTGCAIVGARALHLLHDWHHYHNVTDLLSLWQGGLSFLGGLLGVLIFAPLFLKYNAIKILPFLDLLALYAPIPLAIGRIGCLLAGCCCGIPTTAPWGITFTNQCTQGQLCVPLHPTQLYSAIALFVIFLILYYIVQSRSPQPGKLFCIFLMLVSIERFVVDFYRSDRELMMSAGSLMISVHQTIAIALFITATGLFFYISGKKNSVSI